MNSMLTGRTLMGHDSAKNQQMDDHYFGAIPERVQAFMKDLWFIDDTVLNMVHLRNNP